RTAGASPSGPGRPVRSLPLEERFAGYGGVLADQLDAAPARSAVRNLEVRSRSHPSPSRVAAHVAGVQWAGEQAGLSPRSCEATIRSGLNWSITRNGQRRAA